MLLLKRVVPTTAVNLVSGKKQIIFYALNSCKIDKDNQDLLEIKTCSVIEREKVLTQEGDKAAKEEGDSRTNQTSLDRTCK